MTTQPPVPGPREIRPEDVRTGPPPPRTPPRRGLMAAFGDDRLRAALVVALAADFLQWIALPLFAAGALAPWNDVLDVAVAVILVRLLGWHWAFLPTFVVELFPVADLVPTWTLAVLLASRRLPAPKEPA